MGYGESESFQDVHETMQMQDITAETMQDETRYCLFIRLTLYNPQNTPSNGLPFGE